MRDSNTYQQFSMVDERISTGVKELMVEMENEVEGGTSFPRRGIRLTVVKASRLAWWEHWLWPSAVRRRGVVDDADERAQISIDSTRRGRCPHR